MNDFDAPERSSVTAQQGSVAIGGDVGGDVHIHWTPAEAPNLPQFKRYLRMLAVVAAPVVGAMVDDPPPARLDLWAEWRRLEESIRGAWDEVLGQGAPWAIVRLNPPTRHHLVDALMAGDAASAYQVIHFSGHGAPNGLALEDELGCTDFVTDEELVTIFRNRPVRLVVFNACHTEALARRLHAEAGVPAVIATTDSLRDDEARLLTARLYAQLARGCAVAEAFDEARAALRHAYERGSLPISLSECADTETYIAERLDVLLMLGNATLRLPPKAKRAQRPLITLSEPPSRGFAMHLVEGFVGRGSELVQIARWLRERPSPVIALSGLGGIGKSALVATATLRGSWRFKAVVYLSARDEPNLKPDALVPLLDSVLGRQGDLVSTPTAMERLERAIAALNQTPTLLVLDNLEDLTTATTRAWADFLGRMDPRRGSLAVLTLRPAVKHPLTDLAGAAHLPLERLSEPDALRLLADGLTAREQWNTVPSVDELSSVQRRRLERLARQAHLEWLPAGRLAALDDLAMKAGRHPYTLRLAVGDLRYDHVNWAKLLTNVSDLRGNDWQVKAEKMVGQMIVDLARVHPEAVGLLQALLAFRDGATYAALRAVTVTEDDELIFDDQLRLAIDASLLEISGTGKRPRYDLHPLTRSYLEGYHISHSVLHTIRCRHMQYFVDWTKQHHDEYDRIVEELTNLKQACKYLAGKGDTSDGDLVEIVSNVLPALTGANYWGDLAFFLEKAQEACGRLGDRRRQAGFIADLAQILLNQSAYELALGWAEKATELAIETGDEKTLAEANLRAGWVCMYLGYFKKALEYLRESEELAERFEYLEVLASSYHFTFRVYTEMGDFDRALNYFRARAKLPQQAKPPGAWAFTWLRGAELYLARGDVDVAMRLALKGTEIFESLENSCNPYALRTLGQIHLANGDVELAIELLCEALQNMKYRRGEINVRQDLVNAYIQIGALDKALQLVDSVLRHRRAAQEKKWLADALYLKGQALECVGNLQDALDCYEESLMLYKQTGCLPVITADTQCAIARIESASIEEQKCFT